MWGENKKFSSKSFTYMLSVAKFSLVSLLLRVTWYGWQDLPPLLSVLPWLLPLKANKGWCHSVALLFETASWKIKTPSLWAPTENLNEMTRVRHFLRPLPSRISTLVHFSLPSYPLQWLLSQTTIIHHPQSLKKRFLALPLIRRRGIL